MYAQKDITDLVDIIRKYIPNNLNSIILFGSYANNTQSNSSDLDIAIIVDKRLDRKEKHILLNYLWWDSTKKGLLVDYVFKSINEYESDKTLPTLSKVISKEGRILWKRN